MKETEKIDHDVISVTQEFCSQEIDAWNYHLARHTGERAKENILKMIKGYRAIKDALEKMK